MVLGWWVGGLKKLARYILSVKMVLFYVFLALNESHHIGGGTASSHHMDVIQFNFARRVCGWSTSKIKKNTKCLKDQGDYG